MPIGRVVRVHGAPNPHSFIIQDEDGNEYFAHLGDIRANEELLYNHEDTQHLVVDEYIEFEIRDNNRAIRINRMDDE